MLNESNDVLGMKKLLNQTNINVDNERIRESRSLLFDELLKALSNVSWEMKNEVTKIKRGLLETMNNTVEGKIWEGKLGELVEENPDSRYLMMSLNVFSAMKEIGLGNDEKAESYNSGLPPQPDDNLRNISKRFVQYEDAFVGYYEKLAMEYMRKNKKIPDYKAILKICFCDYVERYMKTYVKNMKFTEERFKEGFGVIQERLKEKGFNLEASDNIKQSFIDLCREKYPLAKKSCNFLFDNKSLKRDFLIETDKGLGHDLGDYFEDIIDSCKKDMEKDDELRDLLDVDREWTLLINLIVNMVINVSDLIDEGTWDDEVLGWYFIYIADEFERDHNKKFERTKEKQKISVSKNISESIIPEQPKTTWKDVLSEKENNLIEEAVSYIKCKGKDSIVKYITKLKIKDLPISFYDLKRLFNLEEIPAQTESILIDQLGMDYEMEEEIIKAKEEEGEEKDESQEETLVTEGVEIQDPAEYLVDKLKSVGCIFDNELTARKQIYEFCQNDDYKTVLVNLMKSPRFGKVFLHKSGHKTARTLRIGMTGWRLLFAKRKDGNLHFVCFANHNTYEDRLAMLK